MLLALIRRWRCRHPFWIVASDCRAELDADGKPLPWPLVSTTLRCPACGTTKAGERRRSDATAGRVDKDGWPLDRDGRRLSPLQD